MPSERILIVDDHPANLKLIDVLLRIHGYATRTAVDADGALSAARDFRPRLILMDLQLPGMDGLEVTRRLKADPEQRDTIVLALTAYAMKGDEGKARDAGCDGYVTKPINTRTLPGVIAAFLGDAPTGSVE